MKVHLFDKTLRDRTPSQGHGLSADVKLKFASLLELTNIRLRAHSLFVRRTVFARKGGAQVEAVEISTSTHEHIASKLISNQRIRQAFQDELEIVLAPERTCITKFTGRDMRPAADTVAKPKRALESRIC
jgi:isopropylmalate/homocitrate/citramalate synthase